MVRAYFYNFKDPKPEQHDPADISELMQREDGVLWVDLNSRDAADLDRLEAEFHFHPLAMEDVRHKNQRSKVAEYDGYVFCVLYEIDRNSDNSDPKEPCVKRGAEVHSFAGRNFFVSVHDGKARSVDTTRRRWESSLDQQKLGPYYALYLLIDTVTDEYFPALDVFDSLVEELEDQITTPSVEEKRLQDTAGGTAGRDRAAMAELINLRHNLIMMRRVVTPLRDAFNVLLRRVDDIQESPVNESDSHGRERATRARLLFAYFQDVFDHTIRIVDTLDTYRDILSGLVDANLSMVSNRTNDIMKVLTSVSIVLMSISVVTGWYGMNFENMPELHTRYGYGFAAAFIVIVCGLELRYFRGRHWI